MTGLLVRKDGKNAEFINFDYADKVSVVNNNLVAFSARKGTGEEFNEYYKDGQWKAISTLEELSDLLSTN